jgi:hypothetical protein
MDRPARIVEEFNRIKTSTKPQYMRKVSERPARRRKLMATTVEGKHFPRRAETVFHPIVAEDKTAMAAMRAIVEPNKGRLQGTAARVPFDGIMEHVAVPEGVTFEAGRGWYSWVLVAQRSVDNMDFSH